jgi:hypothetical protein
MRVKRNRNTLLQKERVPSEDLWRSSTFEDTAPSPKKKGAQERRHTEQKFHPESNPSSVWKKLAWSEWINGSERSDDTIMHSYRIENGQSQPSTDATRSELKIKLSGAPLKSTTKQPEAKRSK